MQFNMQFGQIWDDAAPNTAPIDLEGTIAEIRSHKPDIFLLQEVEHAVNERTNASFSPNYERLKAAFGGEYDNHFSMPRPDPRELPFGVGLAIFSRTPLFETLRLDLPSPEVHFEFNGEDKTPTDRLLIGAATLIEGRRLQVFNTHLLAFFMLQSSSQQYPEQRNTVAQLLKDSKGPTFIGGDFNVSHHESLMAQMQTVGYRTVQSSQITWRRMPFVLDHIFHNAQLRCLGHQVVPTLASDHHILLADFELA